MTGVDRREVYRYLGYRHKEPDPGVREAVEECIAELSESAEPKRYYRVFPLSFAGEHDLRIGDMEIRSRDLAKNLAGCSEACLMAATLGLGPDRLYARASALGKMSRAVILQAAAAAMIESWCDSVNDEVRAGASARGLYTRPRFSPGYGDFGLAYQEELFRILEIPKRIGVTLTAGLLMMPTKSVTAVIGLSGSDGGYCAGGCASCGRTDCAFRRQESV